MRLGLSSARSLRGEGSKVKALRSSVLAAAALSIFSRAPSLLEAFSPSRSSFSLRKNVLLPSQSANLCFSRHSIRSALAATSSSSLDTDERKNSKEQMSTEGVNGEWSDVLPMEDGSHNSARVNVAQLDDSVLCNDDSEFERRLRATLTACRELGKSSLWVEVPLSRARLMEPMGQVGLRFHHAEGETAVLSIWLQQGVASKIPDFATHNVGVGAVVVNSRDEILCVRELRRNYRPWKTPTGLTELGEHIDKGAVREVLEETGIHTKFHSLLGFRQTHGLAHGRSDLFFVCRLDPIEELDEDGNAIIPDPSPQECEIEKAEWVPLATYRAMVNGDDGEHPPHPMMQHVLQVLDQERRIERKVVESIVPGRKPNAMFYPAGGKESSDSII